MHTTQQLASRAQSGFTLIEMLISMALGIVLVGGAFGIVISSSHTQEKSSNNAMLLSNTRTVEGILGDDIRQAGMFGRLQGADIIEGRLGAANELPALSGDCSNRFYINLQQYVFATDNTNPWNATCIGSDYVTDTDILVVRYTSMDDLDHAEWNALPTDSAYLYSNPAGGRLFLTGTNPPTTIGYGSAYAPEAERLINPLNTYIYYVSEPTADEPTRTLRRKGLSPLAGQLFDAADEDDVLATGIEDFQVLLGVEDCNSSTNPCAGNVTEYRPASALDWTDPTLVTRIRAVRVMTHTVNTTENDSVAERSYTALDGSILTVPANQRVWQGTFQIRNSH